MLQVFLILALVVGCTAFLGRSTRLHVHMGVHMQLNTGDYENVKFRKLATDASGASTSDVAETDIGTYKLEAMLSKAEMNVYLNEYKDEMKRRKVVFPGFRPGKLPPYVMGDVRKYLVCYGLENTIGQLCNYNALMLCDAEGTEVVLGEDEYYSTIIQEDFRGFAYDAQRDAWREGTDFTFSAVFQAKVEAGAATAQEEVVAVDVSVPASVGTSDVIIGDAVVSSVNSSGVISSGGGDMTKSTVPELKAMLKARGLRVSGNKADLITRLEGQ